jgi:hypothetical protein
LGPLWGLLTPHKVFRRQFLVDTGIRFPEGPRRLEDHAFLVRAYFAATTISVLADYPCYYWLFHDGWHHGSSGIDPESYYPFLEEVLDLVEENTEPGPARDRLLVRWYSTKVLGFIERSVSRWEPERRAALLRITSELARTRFADVDPYLPPVRRVLSCLLRTGRLEDLETLTEALAGVTADPRVLRAQWSDGELVVQVSLALRYADGRPVRFATGGGRFRWLPELVEDLPQDLVDVTGELGEVSVSAIVHLRGGGTPHPAQVEGGLALSGDGCSGLAQLGGAVTLHLAPRTADYGRPLDSGRWYVRVSTGALGISTTDHVTIHPDLLPPPALLTGLPVVPYSTVLGKLALAVASEEVALVARALPAPRNVHLPAEVTGARLVVDLPRLHAHGDGQRHGTLRIGGLSLPATLVAEAGVARLESSFGVRPGRGRLELELELDGTRSSLGLALAMGPNGRMRPVLLDPKNGSRHPARHGWPGPAWRRAAGKTPGPRWARAPFCGSDAIYHPAACGRPGLVGGRQRATPRSGPRQFWRRLYWQAKTAGTLYQTAFRHELRALGLRFTLREAGSGARSGPGHPRRLGQPAPSLQRPRFGPESAPRRPGTGDGKVSMSDDHVMKAAAHREEAEPGHADRDQGWTEGGSAGSRVCGRGSPSASCGSESSGRFLPPNPARAGLVWHQSR